MADPACSMVDFRPVVPDPQTGTANAFLPHINTLRAIAIIVVVAAHAVWTLSWQPDSVTQHLLAFLFANISLPLVFVSGLLFHHLHYRYTYGSYLRRKFLHVIVPYLVVSLPAVFIALSRNPPPEAIYPQLAGYSRLYQFGWYYLKGGAHLNFPLWFVPMIALFYLAAPAFSACTRQPRWYWVILPFSAVSVLLHRTCFPNLDTLHSAVYFLPAYLLGMWYRQYSQTIEAAFAQRRRWLRGLIVATLLLTWVLDKNLGNYLESGWFTFESGLIDWLFVQKMLLSVLLSVEIRFWPAALHGRLAGIGCASFAIFFLHAYLLRFAWRIGINGHPGSGSAAWWFLLTGVIFVSSYLAAVGIRRITPRWSRYLIGY